MYYLLGFIQTEKKDMKYKLILVVAYLPKNMRNIHVSELTNVVLINSNI